MKTIQLPLLPDIEARQILTKDGYQTRYFVKSIKGSKFGRSYGYTSKAKLMNAYKWYYNNKYKKLNNDPVNTFTDYYEQNKVDKMRRANTLNNWFCTSNEVH